MNEFPIGPNPCLLCGGEYGKHRPECQHAEQPAQAAKSQRFVGAPDNEFETVKAELAKVKAENERLRAERDQLRVELADANDNLRRIAIFHNGCPWPLPENSPPLYIINRSTMGDYEDRIRNLERERDQLRQRVADVLTAMRTLYREADNDRLEDGRKHGDEAGRWQAEGDWYGWNFHKGYEAGTIGASFAFYRIAKAIDAELESKGGGCD